MGFDTSHHPLDLAITRDVLRALATPEGLESLASRVAERQCVQHAAKAWALAALEKGGSLSGFDDELHVWGRPYLSPAEDPVVASAEIDRWLSVSPAGANDLARELLAARWGGAADSVKIDGQALPEIDVLRRGFLAQVQVVHRVLRALEEGRAVELAGETLDPVEVVAEDAHAIAFIVLRVSSAFRPGWMDRGACPSWVLGASAGDEAPLFGPPLPLIEPLLSHIEGRPLWLPDTIEWNEQVGGYVAGADVPRLVRAMEAARMAAEGGGTPACSLLKMHEAATDAERRGLAFVEATEIYSAFLGTTS